MTEMMLPLRGLSPVNGKASSARFDGGALSSDAGLLALREVVLRLDVAGRLATGIDDLRDPTRTVHSVTDILRFRMLLIGADYEDGIDANALRADAVFKLALERLPGERDLCSQSTISRLENLPDLRMLLEITRSMVGLYCASFAQVPKRITLDIDDTSRSSSGVSGGDAVHGGQHLRLFNAHDDAYGFQPIVVFDGAGRFVAAVLRPARRLKGREIAAHLRRLIREIRSHWPRVEMLLRGDSHYCAPEVLDLCRARGMDFILGLASNANSRPGSPRSLLRGVGRRRTATLEQSTIARVDQNSHTKVRRSRSFTTPPHHGAAWSASSPASKPGRRAATPNFHPAARARRRPPLYRYQSHPWQWQGSLRETVLRPQPSREPHQGLEDAGIPSGAGFDATGKTKKQSASTT